MTPTYNPSLPPDYWSAHYKDIAYIKACMTKPDLTGLQVSDVHSRIVELWRDNPPGLDDMHPGGFIEVIAWLRPWVCLSYARPGNGFLWETRRIDKCAIEKSALRFLYANDKE